MRTLLASLCKLQHFKLKHTRLTFYSILGSTYTGAFESVQDMTQELDRYEAETGISVPIHVDAASGGFVA